MKQVFDKGYIDIIYSPSSLQVGGLFWGRDTDTEVIGYLTFKDDGKKLLSFNTICII